MSSTFAHIQPAWLVTLCLQGACGVVIDKKGDPIRLGIIENRTELKLSKNIPRIDNIINA